MTVSFASNVVAGLIIRFAIGEYDALRILWGVEDDEMALFLSVSLSLSLSDCLSVSLSPLRYAYPEKAEFPNKMSVNSFYVL